MPRRIGIYDPAFNKQGHFVAFDRYIAELIDNPEIEVVFLDTQNMMRESYITNLTLSNTPEFISVDSFQENSSRNTSAHKRVLNIIRRYNRWRNVLRAIADLNLDLVLITSESYDPLFYLSRPNFKYGLFILNPRLYIYPPIDLRWIIRKIFFLVYKRFYHQWAHRAAFTVTTNEPPMIPGVEKRLGIQNIPWLPNLYLDQKENNMKTERKPRDLDFLTIGTISKSKNHLFALRTFKEKTLPYKYTIAGLARDTVGHEVEKQVSELEKDPQFHIKGNFGYIDSDTYVELIKNTNFMLLPYDFARGNISSQVMHECFMFEIPIIAPDIEPFEWYVERYGIGILYKEGDGDSLAEALGRALEVGTEPFMKGFEQLRKDNSFLNARQTLSHLIA